MNDVLARRLDARQLTAIVQRLTGVEALELSSWREEPIAWLNIMGAALSRVSGTATVAGEPSSIPWSFVLKRFKKPAADSPSANPGDWEYWKREVIAYESGVLTRLPGGLVAPRYLGLIDEPDGTLRLAMQEITDSLSDPWSFDRYRRAARTVGRFNAGYLQNQPLRAEPAFGPGNLRSWVEALAAVTNETPGMWELPLVARAIPRPDEARRLFDHRLGLLNALDRITQTFVHRDLWSANLLVRRVSAIEEFVAIDWTLAGQGALGEDVAGIVGPTLWHFVVQPADARELESAVLDGYIAGLRDGGWTGDEDVVRFGYAASVALRFGLLVPPWLGLWLSSPEFGGDWAVRKFGRPIEGIVDGWAEVLRFLLARADEARRLASSFGLP